MALQLIKRKPLIFRVKKIDYEFVKPKYLIPVNELRMIEAKVKGSTMLWNIEGEQVSYNQIKALIQ